MENENKTIPLRLREERNRFSLTQEDVASRCDTTVQTVRRWEKKPTIPAEKIAVLVSIGFDAQYIFTGIRSDHYAKHDRQVVRETAARLKMIFEAMGGKDVRDWAAELDEDDRRLEYILAGELPLPADLLKKLVDKGFSADWLLTGTGRMHRMPPELVDKRLREYEPISKRERSLLDKYRVCESDDQDALYRVSKGLAEKHRKD